VGARGFCVVLYAFWYEIGADHGRSARSVKTAPQAFSPFRLGLEIDAKSGHKRSHEHPLARPAPSGFSLLP